MAKRAKTNSFDRLVSVLAIGATLCATPVLAQDDDEDGDDGIIIVTAQFRDQNVQETPLAITAVDAGMMEARSQYTVESVAQRAPSVQFSAGGQGGGTVHKRNLLRLQGQPQPFNPIRNRRCHGPHHPVIWINR